MDKILRESKTDKIFQNQKKQFTNFANKNDIYNNDYLNLDIYEKWRNINIDKDEKKHWNDKYVKMVLNMDSNFLEKNIKNFIRKGVCDSLKHLIWIRANDVNYFVINFPKFYETTLYNTFGDKIPVILSSDCPTFCGGILGLQEDIMCVQTKIEEIEIDNAIDSNNLNINDSTSNILQILFNNPNENRKYSDKYLLPEHNFWIEPKALSSPNFLVTSSIKKKQKFLYIKNVKNKILKNKKINNYLRISSDSILPYSKNDKCKGHNGNDNCNICNKELHKSCTCILVNGKIFKDKKNIFNFHHIDKEHFHFSNYNHHNEKYIYIKDDIISLHEISDKRMKDKDKHLMDSNKITSMNSVNYIDTYETFHTNISNNINNLNILTIKKFPDSKDLSDSYKYLHIQHYMNEQYRKSKKQAEKMSKAQMYLRTKKKKRSFKSSEEEGKNYDMKKNSLNEENFDNISDISDEKNEIYNYTVDKFTSFNKTKNFFKKKFQSKNHSKRNERNMSDHIILLLNNNNVPMSEDDKLKNEALSRQYTSSSKKELTLENVKTYNELDEYKQEDITNSENIKDKNSISTKGSIVKLTTFDSKEIKNEKHGSVEFNDSEVYVLKKTESSNKKSIFKMIKNIFFGKGKTKNGNKKELKKEKLQMDNKYNYEDKKHELESKKSFNIHFKLDDEPKETYIENNKENKSFKQNEDIYSNENSMEEINNKDNKQEKLYYAKEEEYNENNKEINDNNNDNNIYNIVIHNYETNSKYIHTIDNAKKNNVSFNNRFNNTIPSILKTNKRRNKKSNFNNKMKSCLSDSDVSKDTNLMDEDEEYNEFNTNKNTKVVKIRSNDELKMSEKLNKDNTILNENSILNDDNLQNNYILKNNENINENNNNDNIYDFYTEKENNFLENKKTNNIDITNENNQDDYNELDKFKLPLRITNDNYVNEKKKKNKNKKINFYFTEDENEKNKEENKINKKKYNRVTIDQNTNIIEESDDSILSKKTKKMIKKKKHIVKIKEDYGDNNYDNEEEYCDEYEKDEKIYEEELFDDKEENNEKKEDNEYKNITNNDNTNNKNNIIFEKDLYNKFYEPINESCNTYPNVYNLDDATELTVLLNEKGKHEIKKLLWAINNNFGNDVEFAPIIPNLCIILLIYFKASIVYCIIHCLIKKGIDSIKNNEAPFFIYKRKDFVKYVKYVLNSFIRFLPKCYYYLRKLNFDLAAWTARCIQDGFSRMLPFDFVLRIYGIYLFEGQKTLCLYCLALLKFLETDILKCTNAEQVENILYHICMHPYLNLNELTEMAYKFKLKSKEKHLKFSTKCPSPYLMNVKIKTFYRPRLSDNSSIINSFHWENIWAKIPSNIRTLDPFLTFCSKKDGYNLQMLLEKTEKHKKKPMILILKTVNSDLIGFYCPFSFNRDIAHFRDYDKSDSFICNFENAFQFYKWSGKNNMLILIKDGIYIGANDIALYIDQDMKYGKTNPSESFYSPALVKNGNDFKIAEVEIWNLK